MNKSNKITLITVILITVILIGAIIVAVVIRGDPSKTPPVVDTSGQTETTEPDGSETTKPVIDIPEDPGDPGDHSGVNQPGDENQDNITVDVVEKNEENKREPEPGVIGDVVIIPGVKTESEAN